MLLILLFLLVILILLIKKNNKETFENKSNIFFIHIPKNAGSTINKHFKDNYKIYVGKYFFLKNYKKYKNIKKKYGISTYHIPPSYFEKDNNPYDNKELFCVVRNPYDRMVSEFKFYNKFYKKNHNPSKENLNKFIKKLPKLIQGKKIKYDGHLLPQYKYLENTNIKYENILKFENLEDDFNNFCLNNNLPIHKLSKNNKTISKLSVEDLDQESKDIIYEIYEKDFKNFGYLKK